MTSSSGGSLEPTPATVPAVVGIVGLAGGWLLHPLTDRVGNSPLITWPQPVALAIVAIVIGYAAWATWRTVHVRHERLAAHRAVNRLVLARACVVVGALVGGGYLGYALSWVGSPAELADQRILRGALAAVAGLAIVVVSMLLERACRIRRDDSET